MNFLVIITLYTMASKMHVNLIYWEYNISSVYKYIYIYIYEIIIDTWVVYENLCRYILVVRGLELSTTRVKAKIHACKALDVFDAVASSYMGLG